MRKGGKEKGRVEEEGGGMRKGKKKSLHTLPTPNNREHLSPLSPMHLPRLSETVQLNIRPSASPTNSFL